MQGGAEILAGSIMPAAYELISGENNHYSLDILAATLTPFVGLLLADGIYDLVKGTHHYVPSKVIQKLTKSEKLKKEIEESIKWSKIRGEQEGPSLKYMLSLGYLRSDSDKFK